MEKNGNVLQKSSIGGYILISVAVIALITIHTICG